MKNAKFSLAIPTEIPLSLDDLINQFGKSMLLASPELGVKEQITFYSDKKGGNEIGTLEIFMKNMDVLNIMLLLYDRLKGTNFPIDFSIKMGKKKIKFDLGKKPTPKKMRKIFEAFLDLFLAELLRHTR